MKSKTKEKKKRNRILSFSVFVRRDYWHYKFIHKIGRTGNCTTARGQTVLSSAAGRVGKTYLKKAFLDVYTIFCGHFFAGDRVFKNVVCVYTHFFSFYSLFRPLEMSLLCKRYLWCCQDVLNKSNIFFSCSLLGQSFFYTFFSLCHFVLFCECYHFYIFFKELKTQVLILVTLRYMIFYVN